MFILPLFVFVFLVSLDVTRSTSRCNGFDINLEYYNISNGPLALNLEVNPIFSNFSPQWNSKQIPEIECQTIASRNHGDCSLCVSYLVNRAILNQLNVMNNVIDADMPRHDSLVLGLGSIYKSLQPTPQLICVAGVFPTAVISAILLLNQQSSIRWFVPSEQLTEQEQRKLSAAVSAVNALRCVDGTHQHIEGLSPRVTLTLVNQWDGASDWDSEKCDLLQISHNSSPVNVVAALLPNSLDAETDTFREVPVIWESQPPGERDIVESSELFRFTRLASSTVPAQDTIRYDEGAWTHNDAINCHLPVTQDIVEGTEVELSVGVIRMRRPHPFQHFYDSHNQQQQPQRHNASEMISGSYFGLRRGGVSVPAYHYKNVSNAVNELLHRRNKVANSTATDKEQHTEQQSSEQPAPEQIRTFVSFSYNGELIVQLHLEHLYAHVDCFLVVEAWETFSGKRKEFLFIDRYRAIFEPYMDKVQFIVIDSFPAPSAAWLDSYITEHLDRDRGHVGTLDRARNWYREMYQRDVAGDFLAKAYNSSKSSESDDVSTAQQKFILFVVDADEIVTRDAVIVGKVHYMRAHKPIYLVMDMWYYDLQRKLSYEWSHAFCINDKGELKRLI